MKKIVMLSIVLVVVAASFISKNNVFAVGIGGQSIDVTVGEVDKIDVNEDQDINAPQTGVFGLEFDGDFVATSVVLIIPIIILLIFLAKNYHRRAK